MRPIRITFTMVAADADGVCASQTPAVGGSQSLTIAGALATGGVATMDVARHVSITSDGDDSARTFTVTGTDRYGASISETITGPDTATVTGEVNFKTVTAVTVDDDTAGAITVGSADEADTAWIPLCRYKTPFNVNISGELDSGAGLTFAVEHTNDNVQATGFQEPDATAFTHSTITGKTANFEGSYSQPVSAIRGAITSHTTGGMTLNITQAG